MSIQAKNLHSLIYLDRVRRLYPQGVLRSLIVSPNELISREQVVPQVQVFREDGDVRQSYVCTLCIVAEGREPDGMDRRALIEAICTKGLRLAMNRCEIRRFAREGLSEESLIKDVQRCESPIVIVLGADHAPQAITVVGEQTVLRTYSLERISSDAGAKLDFWRQLQAGILPLLREHS